MCNEYWGRGGEGSWVVGVLASARPRAGLSLGLPGPHYHLVQENLRPTGQACPVNPLSYQFWPPGGMLSSLSVQFPSVAQSCWTLQPHGLQQRQASLSITNSGSFLKLMFIESVMLSNHLILCPPLLLPSIFPSIRVFSKESVFCIRWPKY